MIVPFLSGRRVGTAGRSGPSVTHPVWGVRLEKKKKTYLLSRLFAPEFTGTATLRL